MANNQPPYDLSILARNREQLLLAEIAALIHDWKKCSDEQLKSMTKSYFEKGMNGNETLFKQRCPFTDLDEIKKAQGISRTEFGKLFSKLLEQYPVLNLGGKEYKFDEFVSSKKYGFRGQEDHNLDYPILLARVAHHRAHIEKEKEDTDFEGAQCWPNIRASNAFGFEDEKPLSGLTKILYGLGEDKDKELSGLDHRKKLLDDIKKKWDVAISDSRRPVNEVNLWDWSYVVASLYKPEIARWLLTNEKRNSDEISWRLLSIRTDGLQYMLSAPGVPDMLARKKLLQDGWNKVKELIEEQYPLGLEVYRDENGPVYVVPDIDELTSVLIDKKLENEPALRALIYSAFAEGTMDSDSCLRLGGEVIPQIKEDEKGWKAEGEDIPPIEKHLDEKIGLESDPSQLRDAWCNGHIADICTVCGLRPQGPGLKAAERNVCDICERRRADRAKEWALNLGQVSDTIWTDEVADANGRLALLTGHFELTHWLSGNLVRTLAVRAPKDDHTSRDVFKNPSFARLRRIWETTRKFWEEVVEGETSLIKKVYRERTDIRFQRLILRGKLEEGGSLGPYHSYELKIRGVNVPVLWVPRDSKAPEGGNYFVTTVNLQWLIWQLFSGEKRINYEATSWQEAFREIFSEESLQLEAPGGYGLENKKLGSFQLDEVSEAIMLSRNFSYLPVIPILTEPTTFMLLLPAEQALQMVEAIREKYEREMGKVRNRLPMHLGLVFAHKRTPLRALFDAGRQMLRRSFKGGIWKVMEVQEVNSGTLPAWLQDEAHAHFAKCKKIVLESDERILTWHVPLAMGDGATSDDWYPYAFLVSDAEPSDRTLYFQTEGNPFSSSHNWLVHARELKVNDTIYFTPATFDYEFLDVTTRRFELHYDAEGKRTGSPRRPYLLDELDLWHRIQNHLAFLEKQQIYQLVHVIEATAELWGLDERGREDETFRQFVADTLTTAAYPKEHKWSSIPEEDKNLMVDAGVSGMLKDLVELHFQILKTRFSTVNPT